MRETLPCNFEMNQYMVVHISIGFGGGSKAEEQLVTLKLIYTQIIVQTQNLICRNTLTFWKYKVRQGLIKLDIKINAEPK